MPSILRQLALAISLALLAASLSACVVEPAGRPGGGYCYWHPLACR